MFKDFANLASLMRSGQEMAGKMQEQRQRLQGETHTGSAGGGMVEVDVNGLGDLRRVRIEPSLVEKGEREMIEDLVTAAANQAIGRAREQQMSGMQQMLGGLPGLDRILETLQGDEPPR